MVPRMGNETLRPLGFGPCFGRKLQTKKLMMYSHLYCGTPVVQGSLLFVTYTIILGIISSEMLVRTGPLNGKCKKIKNNNKIKIT